jgi:hypothetical protein
MQQGQHGVSCIEMHHMQAAACSSNLDICVSNNTACDGDALRTIMTQRHVPDDLYKQPKARSGLVMLPALKPHTKSSQEKPLMLMRLARATWQ